MFHDVANFVTEVPQSDAGRLFADRTRAGHYVPIGRNLRKRAAGELGSCFEYSIRQARVGHQSIDMLFGCLRMMSVAFIQPFDFQQGFIYS